MAIIFLFVIRFLHLRYRSFQHYILIPRYNTNNTKIVVKKCQIWLNIISSNESGRQSDWFGVTTKFGCGRGYGRWRMQKRMRNRRGVSTYSVSTKSHNIMEIINPREISRTLTVWPDSGLRCHGNAPLSWRYGNKTRHWLYLDKIKIFSTKTWNQENITKIEPHNNTDHAKPRSWGTSNCKMDEQVQQKPACFQ